MNMNVYCHDLYDLNDGNTEFYDEHKRWYNDFRANSLGDLLDKQQDMIDSYKRAVDNSTQEIADLKYELQSKLNDILNLEAAIQDIHAKYKDERPNMIGQL